MTFLYNYRHSTLGMVRNFRKCLLLQRVSGGCRLRKECFLHATGLKQSKGEERLIFSASKTEMWDEKCVDDGVLRCGFFSKKNDRGNTTRVAVYFLTNIANGVSPARCISRNRADTSVIRVAFNCILNVLRTH